MKDADLARARSVSRDSTNWTSMSEQERQVTKRRIAKRNIERLQAFRDRGELKEDLVSALQSSSCS